MYMGRFTYSLILGDHMKCAFIPADSFRIHDAAIHCDNGTSHTARILFSSQQSIKKTQLYVYSPHIPRK